MPVSTEILTMKFIYTGDDSLQLPLPVITAMNEDWTGKGARPKTSDVIQSQAVATATSSTNTGPIGIKQRQGKQKVLVAIEEIVNGRSIPHLESEREVMEVGASATHPQRTSGSPVVAESDILPTNTAQTKSVRGTTVLTGDLTSDYLDISELDPQNIS